MEPTGKIGPLPMAGAIAAADKQDIWDKTKCSASLRGRPNMERSLTISGPLSKLQAAHTLAMEAVAKNQRLLEAGGSLPAGG
eukprot:11028642-Alexandrium_andersonii.AAC.1